MAANWEDGNGRNKMVLNWDNFLRLAGAALGGMWILVVIQDEKAFLGGTIREYLSGSYYLYAVVVTMVTILIEFRRKRKLYNLCLGFFCTFPLMIFALIYLNWPLW